MVAAAGAAVAVEEDIPWEEGRMDQGPVGACPCAPSCEAAAATTQHSVPLVTNRESMARVAQYWSGYILLTIPVRIRMWVHPRWRWLSTT